MQCCLNSNKYLKEKDLSNDRQAGIHLALARERHFGRAARPAASPADALAGVNSSKSRWACCWESRLGFQSFTRKANACSNGRGHCRRHPLDARGALEPRAAIQQRNASALRAALTPAESVVG